MIYKPRKKIIFFSDHEWSLGRCNSELIKYLWQYNIDGQLLTWQKPLPGNLEMLQMTKATDYFVSSALGPQYLHEVYQVPTEKIIFAIYHRVDINYLINWGSKAKECKIITVSDDLVSAIKSAGFDAKLVRLGINTGAFYQEPSLNLSVIGYASVYGSRDAVNNGKANRVDEPWIHKRGYLVAEIGAQLNIPVKLAVQHHTTFRTMPGFYSTVDVLMSASDDQGAGFPVLEAAAAGRLVMTADCGEASSYVTELGADILPVDESLYCQEAIRLLSFYRSNPHAYRDRCYAIREYALKKYDLSACIYQWADLFLS